MTFSAFISVLRGIFSGAPLDPLARGAWCRKQRLHLSVPGHPVVWIRGDALTWAEWGARRGYFEVGRMDGLPYLRAVGSQIL